MNGFQKSGSQESGVREDHAERGSTRAVVGNASDVVHDVTELIELQGKLLAADLKLTGRRASAPALLLTTGVCGLLGLVPILLLGVAELFAEHFQLTRPLALLASAGCGLLVSVLSLLGGWLLLRRALTQLNNSGRELKRNLNWIKLTLRSAGSRS